MCVRARGSTVRESGYNRVVYLGHELLEEKKRGREEQREEEIKRKIGILSFLCRGISESVYVSAFENECVCESEYMSVHANECMR